MTNDDSGPREGCAVQWIYAGLCLSVTLAEAVGLVREVSYDHEGTARGD